MAAYLTAINTTDGYADWPLNTVRYFVYDQNLAESAANALFQGLSFAQKLAQTTTTIPSPPAGQVWVVRTSGGGSNTGDGVQYVSEAQGNLNSPDFGNWTDRIKLKVIPGSINLTAQTARLTNELHTTGMVYHVKGEWLASLAELEAYEFDFDNFYCVRVVIPVNPSAPRYTWFQGGIQSQQYIYFT